MIGIELWPHQLRPSINPYSRVWGMLWNALQHTKAVSDGKAIRCLCAV